MLRLIGMSEHTFLYMIMAADHVHRCRNPETRWGRQLRAERSRHADYYRLAFYNGRLAVFNYSVSVRSEKRLLSEPPL